jgi:hypothetical protein
MPLLRLLGVNCAAGIAVALLAVGALLTIDTQLRDLIFSDRAPGVALTLLAGGFIVTFASAVMGSAIMRLGEDQSAGLPLSGEGKLARSEIQSARTRRPRR